MFAMSQPRILPRKSCTLAFGALLLLFSVGAAQLCPPGCHSCSVGAVECEQVSSLSDVLVGLSRYTEKIRLRNGNLSVIPPLSFTKFSNLQFLSITGFLVSSLTDLSFSTIHVNSLRILDLSNNHILSCMIEPMAFSGLLFLDELILTNNSLDMVRRSWFSEMPVLSKLFLGVNRIAYLPPRTFERLTKLDELVMSSNLIQHLPMDAFYGLALLTKLDLSSNGILFINQEVFQPLQALKYLLLFQNRLTILPVLPSSITVLFLQENPWECDCQLANSVEPLIAKIQSPADVICNRPPSLAGHQVTSTRPEGCAASSFSSSTTHLLPSTILNLSFFYGFLGGLLVGLIPGLIICCCIPTYCHCTPFESQTEDKQVLQNKSTKTTPSEKRTSNVHLSSSRVRENATPGFEVGHTVRGAYCGCFSGTSRPYGMEQSRSAFKRPLIALLSTDAAGKTIVTLHEKGNEIGCPILGQACCPVHGDGINRVSEAPGYIGACGNPEPHFVKREHGFCCSCIQHATVHQMEKTECVLRKGVDHWLDGWTPHPGTQLGGVQALVHINPPDGGPLKTERDRPTSYETSSKRNEPSQSGLSFHASRGWSGTKRKTLPLRKSSRHRYQGGFTSPRGKASEKRLHRECIMEGRHSKLLTGRGESSWKTDIYSKVYPLSPGKGSRKERKKRPGDLRSLPYCDRTSTSCLSSLLSQPEDYSPSSSKEVYVEMLSVAQRPGKRGGTSQHLDAASQARRALLEHRKAGSQQHDPDVSLSRNAPTIGRHWKCRRCSGKESNPYWIARKGLAQRNATPRTSIRLLEVATQGSSTEIVPLKEREVALAILGLHHDAEKSTSEDIWQSSSWSALCPPCRILHREQSEGETESTYEYPSPRASTTQLDTVFPLTKKTTTQLILKDWDGRLGVMETLETKMMVDHRVSVHPPRCMSIRGLSEEILDAKMPLQALTTGDDGVGSSSNASSNATGLNSCYDAPIGPLFRIDENLLLLELSASDRSYSEVIYPGVQGDGYEEVATITSTCPLVQKMLQIDFPLLAEEENASWSGERKEAGPAAKLVKERSVWLTQESSSGSVGEKVA